jgi:hypothetical protein
MTPRSLQTAASVTPSTSRYIGLSFCNNDNNEVGHYAVVVNTHKLGLLDDSSIDNWSRAIAETLATPGGEQYWEKVAARLSNLNT